MPSLRPGDIDPAVASIKRKLGVFPCSDVFDDRLAMRVRGIQNVFGLPITGVIDDDTAVKAGVEGFLAGVTVR